MGNIICKFVTRELANLTRNYNSVFVYEKGKNVEITDEFKTLGRITNYATVSDLKKDYCLDRLIPAYSSKSIIFFDSIKDANENGFYESKNGFYVEAKSNSTTGIFHQTDMKDHIRSLPGAPTKEEFGEKSQTYLLSGRKEYTFGVEIETIQGLIPDWVYLRENLNLKCERDGSLKNPDGTETGGEYITGVLTGDNGFANLKKSLREISLRCKVDKRCGIHVHVGNCNFNDDFVVLAYILGLRLQDEVWELLPPSRKNNDTCGKLKDEDYQSIIKKYNMGNGLKMCFDDLFVKVSNGRNMDEKCNRKRAHPGGRYTDRYSRGIEPKNLYRYKWLNVVPTMFNMKGNEDNPIYTLEFRCHPASLNFIKIKNWILFCFAFCWYVENKPKDIIFADNLSINDILKEAYNNYPNIYRNLKEYFEERKRVFGDSKTATISEMKEYKQKTINKPVSKSRMIKEMYEK